MEIVDIKGENPLSTHVEYPVSNYFITYWWYESFGFSTGIPLSRLLRKEA